MQADSYEIPVAGERIAKLSFLTLIIIGALGGGYGEVA